MSAPAATKSAVAPARVPSTGGVLQRACACGGTAGPTGECAECRKKHKLGMQPKLRVNRPGDRWEREADRAAELVAGDRQPADASTAPAPLTPLLQRESAGEGLATAPAEVHAVLDSPGRPLDPAARAFMEPRFGHDFAAVRVHTDAQAASSASAVQARAYTVGRHIVFAQGEYDAAGREGRRVLAHELAHVVQQRAAGPAGAPGTLAMGPAGGAAERDAAAVQRAVELDAPLPPIHATSVPAVQRLPGSPAGGCGLCYGGTHLVGQEAHRLAQAAFTGIFPWLQPEHHLPLLMPAPGDTSGFLDLADLVGEDRIAIGEIKPDNTEQRRKGREDLAWYQEQIEAYGFTVERLTLWPPLEAIPFPTLAPPSCLQFQELFINPPEDGLYTYWCMPDYKELIRTCDCRTGRREPRREPVDVPVPVTVPEPEAQRRPVQQPRGEAPGVEEAPETGPEQVPEEVPGQPPGEVIPLFPGRAPETEEEPAGPPEELPVAAMVALAALAALAAQQLRRSASGVAGRLASSTVGRALVYAQMAAAIALIVAYPERVEAQPMGGETPLEALFRALDERGTPLPPELQERVRDDPELARLLEQAASTGDWSAAQAEANAQVVQLISDHPAEFSTEDLEILLGSTEATAPAGSPSVEQLRAAVERARAGTGSQAGESASPAPDAAERHPGLSSTTREQLRAAGQPVQDLFEHMTAGSDGPEVTDEVVARFLQTVPPGLAAEQATRLRARIQPAAGATLDDIMRNLAEAVREVLEPAPAEAELEDVAPEAEPQDAESSDGEIVTESAYIEQMLEAMRSFDQWDSIPIGMILYHPVGGSFGALRPGDEIDCYGYGRASESGGSMRGVVTVRLRLDRRIGAQAEYTLVGSTPVVFENRRTIQVVPDGSLIILE